MALMVLRVPLVAWVVASRHSRSRGRILLRRAAPLPSRVAPAVLALLIVLAATVVLVLLLTDVETAVRWISSILLFGMLMIVVPFLMKEIREIRVQISEIVFAV